MNVVKVVGNSPLSWRLNCDYCEYVSWRRTAEEARRGMKEHLYTDPRHRRDVTPADLRVGDVVTIHHNGEPRQCFCVTETGERFRVRPSVDGDHPPDLATGEWPRLWLEFDTVTYEQLGGTDECYVCTGNMHDNVLLTVPGQLNDDDYDEHCHCGHGYGKHAYHTKFCVRCECDSFHRPGENNDQITERWN